MGDPCFASAYKPKLGDWAGANRKIAIHLDTVQHDVCHTWTTMHKINKGYEFRCIPTPQATNSSHVHSTPDKDHCMRDAFVPSVACFSRNRYSFVLSR